MKKSELLLGTLAGLSLFSATAQELSIDAMIRPRFEYRHGFQDRAVKDAEPSTFVSQRSSLLVGYKDTKISTFIDLQDVSVWGDRPQLARDGGDTFRINQAWAELQLGKGWSTKLGRQIISYDDQRILGGLGWAQQQRTHDAGILKYKKNSLKLDLGFSFNQNAETNFNTNFIASGAGVPVFQYKAMQFLHLSGKLSETLKGSLLFLNNAFQSNGFDNTGSLIDGTPGTTQRQTTGFYGEYNEGKFGLTSSFYYQFGEFGANDINAYQASIFGSYKPGSGALKLIGLGAEVLSGNDERTITDGENEAFFPLFGTNHKFNGFQDFFYVGRFANNVGLIDINAKAVIKTGKKSKLIGFLHYFSAATDMPNDLDKYLGTAIDLVYAQKITSYANIKIGYSHSFLSDDFTQLPTGGPGGGAIADGNEADTQNWGWVMLTVNPNLFKWKKPTE